MNSQSTMLIFKQLSKYLHSFFWLAQQKFLNNKRPSIVAIVGVCVSALIYPFPVLIIISGIVAASKSETNLEFSLNDLFFQVPISLAITIAIFLAITAYLLNYLSDRLIIRLNIEWQRELFTKILMRSTSPLNLKIGNTGLTGPTRSVIAQASKMVGSAMLIGRLVSNGLFGIIVCILTFAVTVFLNYQAALIIIGVSILFLPLYARTFKRISDIRRELFDVRPSIRGRLESILNEVPIANTQRVPIQSDELYDPCYATANYQYFSLNNVSLLVAIHLFSVLTLVLLFFQPQSNGFSDKDLILFGALIIFVRSCTGLMGLLANLTRNFSNMSSLMSFFVNAPAVKPTFKVGDINVLALRSSTEKKLEPGSIYLLPAPRIIKQSQLNTFVDSLIIHENRSTKLEIRQFGMDEPIPEILPIEVGAAIFSRRYWFSLSEFKRQQIIDSPMVLLIRISPNQPEKLFRRDSQAVVVNKFKAIDIILNCEIENSKFKSDNVSNQNLDNFEFDDES